ncbi:MAG: hypothetical protein M1135_01260 [Candidatus Omnitrophica bacterium]|jgi:hypothetical protein|nr:hypothetical protein [Candidatus Omnitrophota bacterium]
MIDFNKIKTYSLKNRNNLVNVDNFLSPFEYKFKKTETEEFSQFIEKLMTAKKDRKLIIWSIGGHVIKCGLSLYLIELVKMGYIQHLAGNGATSIHDFEIALCGATSEDVTNSIKDGSFGMWEETGRYMNQAIITGYKNGYGYGESLARYIEKNPEKFPYKDKCVLYQAYLLKIPTTYHIAIGTDIIHQHPLCNFASIGGTSGIDFNKYCESVSHLENGVFLNFGSAVIGPEVFLKAISIVRNLGYNIQNFTTAVFDFIEHYRPRKNIVERPTGSQGKGFYFHMDHKISIPNIYDKIINYPN